MGEKRNTKAASSYVAKRAVARWRAAGVETVTTRELAAALKITEQAVRTNPSLPYTVVNTRGDRRYSVDVIERYLIANTRQVG
jgi:hypothetical protein